MEFFIGVTLFIRRGSNLVLRVGVHEPEGNNLADALAL